MSIRTTTKPMLLFQMNHKPNQSTIRTQQYSTQKKNQPQLASIYYT